MAGQPIEQYFADRYKKSVDSDEPGKADAITMMAAMGAIATAGQMWNNLPPEERTVENARKISHDSLEPLTTDRSDTTDLLFDKAGTREMVQAYTNDLISRSEVLDGAQGKNPGTNLMGFLDKVGSGVAPINFPEFKKGNLVNLDGSPVNLLAVREITAEATRQYIDPDMKPIDQDIFNTIQRDLEGDGKIFGGVIIESKNLSFAEKTRVGMLAVTYLKALTPIPGGAEMEKESQRPGRAEMEKESQRPGGAEMEKESQSIAPPKIHPMNPEEIAPPKKDAGTDGPDPKSEKPTAGNFSMRPLDDIVALASTLPKEPPSPYAKEHERAMKETQVQAVPQQQRQTGGPQLS
jgi:hypothetical protein